MKRVEGVSEHCHRCVDLVHHRLGARVKVDAQHALSELLWNEVKAQSTIALDFENINFSIFIRIRILHIERPHLRSEVQVGPDDRLGDDPDIGLLGQAGLLRLLHDLLRFLLGAAVKMGQSQQQCRQTFGKYYFACQIQGNSVKI